MTNYSLVGQDGNIFNLIGYVMRAMKSEHFSAKEVKDFQASATSSTSYDDALSKCQSMIDFINSKPATVYYTDGDTKKILPKSIERGFELQELYDIIDCNLVELVTLENGNFLICDEERVLKNGDIIICDEEGRVKENTQLNIAIARRYGLYLCGTIVECTPEYFK